MLLVSLKPLKMSLKKHISNEDFNTCTTTKAINMCVISDYRNLSLHQNPGNQRKV